MMTAGVGEKILTDIAVRGATSLAHRAHKWFTSYDLLILGQERAGKTSFYKFLRQTLLSTDGGLSPPTVDSVNSGIFSFEWQTNTGPLRLEFRNVGDNSGQIGPYKHAELLIHRKPHLLVVVLDLTLREDTDRLHGGYGTWFSYFCAYIGDMLMNRPRRARRLNSRLKTMLVVLNKVDVLNPSDADAIVSEAQSKVRTILTTRLSHHLGNRVSNFPIVPCSMVENPRHGTSQDTIERLRAVISLLVSGMITH